MLICSYYTEQYAEVIQQLQESIDRHQLARYIEPMKDRGSWLKNTWHKPHFLQFVLQTTTDPIVWIDADGQLLRYPWEFGELATKNEYDIAIRPERNNDARNTLCYDPALCNYAARNGDEPLLYQAGTMWLANNPRVRDFLTLWISQEAGCIVNELPDQPPVGWAAREAGLKVYELPHEYCFVYDTDRREHLEADPVIMHFQKSREVRRLEREAPTE